MSAVEFGTNDPSSDVRVLRSLAMELHPKQRDALIAKAEEMRKSNAVDRLSIVRECLRAYRPEDVSVPMSRLDDMIKIHEVERWLTPSFKGDIVLIVARSEHLAAGSPGSSLVRAVTVKVNGMHGGVHGGGISFTRDGDAVLTYRHFYRDVVLGVGNGGVGASGDGSDLTLFVSLPGMSKAVSAVVLHGGTVIPSDAPPPRSAVRVRAGDPIPTEGGVARLLVSGLTGPSAWIDVAGVEEEDGTVEIDHPDSSSSTIAGDTINFMGFVKVSLDSVTVQYVLQLARVEGSPEPSKAALDRVVKKEALRLTSSVFLDIDKATGARRVIVVTPPGAPNDSKPEEVSHQIASRSLKTFDRCMAMYTFDFFDPDMRKFVRSAIADPRRGEARVVVLRRSRPTVDEVTKRIPVYFGRTMSDWFSDDSMKAITGATAAEVEATPRTNPFCIVGRARVFGTRAYITVVHGWALNFETNSTDDFVKYNQRLRSGPELALSELARRARLWVGAAAKTVEDGQAVHMRAPAMGLGAYTQALGEERKQILKRLTITAFAAAAAEFPNVTVEMMNFGGIFTGVTPPEYISPPPVDFRTVRNLRIGPETNLFASERRTDKDGNIVTPFGRLVLLNAYDSHSFIGNGGRNDATIDGWMVAGFGPNDAMKNSSYLHNAVFNPTMKHPENWIEV